MNRAKAFILIIISGCSPVGPSEPEALEVEYTFSGDTEGICYITPIAIGRASAELTTVELAEYGKIVYRNSAEHYWGRSTISAGDTIRGRTMRIYARWDAMIWAWYIQNGKEAVRITTLSCK